MWISGFLRNERLRKKAGCCVKASSLVVAAYGKVRLTPRVSRALPAAFLRSRPKLKAFATFYEVVRNRVSVIMTRAVLRFNLLPIYGAIFFFREGIDKFDIARFLVAGDSSGHKIDQFPLG